MSSAPRFTWHTRAARLVGGLTTALAAALAVGAGTLGCGPLEDRVIARELGDTPEPNARGPRGRVAVVGGNLQTDKGTRLRGVTVAIDVMPDLMVERSTLDELALENGINTLHVFLENFAQATGAHQAAADRLVEATASAGLYLVIAIGGGSRNGSFDLAKTRAFWEHYAPRYAARSHVLYEIHNVPEPECRGALAPATFAMQEEAYRIIRAAAPQTHVLMASLAGIPTREALSAALERFDPTVDWSTASIAAHGSDLCVPFSGYSPIIDQARLRGVAMLIVELPSHSYLPGLLQAEANDVGWMNHRWLVDDQDLEAFRNAHGSANVTWCPDFGTWPQDASACKTP